MSTTALPAAGPAAAGSLPATGAAAAGSLPVAGAAAAGSLPTLQRPQYFKSENPEEVNKYVAFENPTIGSDGKYLITLNYNNLNTFLNTQLVNLVANISNVAIQDKVVPIDTDDVVNILKSKTNTKYEIQDIKLSSNLIIGNINKMLTKINGDIGKQMKNSFFKTITNYNRILEKIRVVNPKNKTVHIAHFKNAIPTDKWKKITNQNSNTLYSKDFDTTNENANTTESSKIQKYFNECEKHQVAYNQKHNELIKLFKFLKNLLTILIKLTDMIKKISEVDATKIKTSKTQRSVIKLLKNVFESKKFNNYLQEQRGIFEVANNFLPTDAQSKTLQFNNTDGTETFVGGSVNNLVGGAAAAPTAAAAPAPAQTGTMTIDTTTTPNTITISPMPSSITNKLKEGSNVLFNVNAKLLIARYKNGNFEVIKANGIDLDDLARDFNTLSAIQKEDSIEVLEYVLENPQAFSLVSALNAIISRNKISLELIKNRMDGINPTPVSNYADYKSYNSNPQTYLNGANTSGKIPMTETTKIENILKHCYDLQILYLIKHLEVVALYKFIIHFLGIFVQFIIILTFILNLYKIFAIGIENIIEEVEIKDLFEKNIKDLLDEQGNTMGTVSQAGGAGDTAFVDTMVASVDNIVVAGEADKHRVLEAEYTKLETKYPNLHQYEANLLQELDKQDTEVNKKNKLYIAYLIVRNARIKKYLTKSGTSLPKETHTKLNEMINKNEKIIIKFENSGQPKLNMTLEDVVNSMDNYTEFIADNIFAEHILQPIVERFGRQEIDTEKAAQAVKHTEPEPQITTTDYEMLGTYKKMRDTQVCKMGDVKACSTDTETFDKAKAIINKFLYEKNNSNKDIDSFIQTLPQHQDDKDKQIITVISMADAISEYYTNPSTTDKLDFNNLSNYIKEQITSLPLKGNVNSVLETVKQELEEKKRLRLAEEARVAEQARLAEAARLKAEKEAEEAQVAAEEAARQRLAEEARLKAEEEARLAAEEAARQRLAEAEEAARQRLAADVLHKLIQLLQIESDTIEKYGSDKLNKIAEITEEQIRHSTLHQLTAYGTRIDNFKAYLTENIPKTVANLKNETKFEELKVVMGIMSAFNSKTEEQKTSTRSILNKTTDAQKMFESLERIYNNMITKEDKEDKEGEGSTFIADLNDDTKQLKSETYEKYKTIIDSAKNDYNALEKDSMIIANLFELIAGAARTILRVKPERDDDNSAPIIKKDEMPLYSIKEYFKKALSQSTQTGGYNYIDIINVIKPTNTIKIGSYCDGILPNDLNYEYGPFSAIYPPQFNNFDIYANMFGTKSISELRNPDGKYSNDTKITTYLNNKILNNGTRTFANISNESQNLMQKLSNDGSVVIFGYGFSGSGKTYSLIEGSRKELPNDKCMDRKTGTITPKKGTPVPASSVGEQNLCVKYDPSLLEQFIKNNAGVIDSVEFKEIYPLGIIGDKNKKIIQADGTFDGAEDYTTSEIIDENKYNIYVKEAQDNLLGDDDLKTKDKKNSCTGTYSAPPKGKSKPNTYNFDLYKAIKLSSLEISEAETIKKYYYISNRIRLLERHRIHNLRILATPNNDNSSRSFLQITINLNHSTADSSKPKPQLVFFDMPGTENTVRIKTEFMGTQIFKDIKEQKNENEITLEKVIQEFERNPIDPPDFIENTLIEMYKKKAQDASIHDTFDEIVEDNTNYEIITKPGLNTLISNITTIKYNNNKKIFSIKINKNVSDKKEFYIKNERNSSINNISEQNLIEKIFKYAVLKRMTFNNVCNIDFKSDESISKIGFDLISFFNGIDVESFKDIELRKEIYFLNDDMYKTIFNKFVSFFTAEYELNKKKESDGKKKESDGKYFSKNKTGNKYCKLECNLNKMDETDKNIFKDIFGIKYGLECSGGSDCMSAITNTKPSITNPFNLSNFGHVPNFITKLVEYKIINITMDKITISDKVYVANPLCKYLLVAIITLFVNIRIKKIDKLEGEINNIFIRASVFFIYKFINFIVKQGRGIVTNLEHLKFFFLSRTAQIETYNNDAENQKLNKTFKYSESTGESTEAKDILTKSKTYTVPTKIKIAAAPAPARAQASPTAQAPAQETKSPDTDDITIDERVDMGHMETYRLLSVLQDLANSENNLSNLQVKNGYLDIMKSKDGGDTGLLGAIFVMFTNIKVFLDKDTDNFIIDNDKLKPELPKLCTAEYDTLEFAESISSATRTKPTRAIPLPTTQSPELTQSSVGTLLAKFKQQSVVGGSLNRYNYKTAKFNLKTFTQYNRNRKIKTRKATTLKKHKHNNAKGNQLNRGRTLFVRRSKKYFN